MTVHILKLCVGIDSVDELRAVHERRLRQARAAGERPVLMHRTRNFPRRVHEILDGGSLYWVIRGTVLVRQPIVGVERLEGGEGTKRCAVLLAPEWVRTRPQPRRPHQGWRYLETDDAPPDVPEGDAAEEDLPPHLVAELRELGLL